MTLVAVLDGRDATLLFADTEETISGYAKREINKLTVQECEVFRFGIAGACSDGTYADMLQSEICSSLSAIRRFDLTEIKEALAVTLTNFYTKHVWPRTGEKPEMSYLLVLQPIAEGNTAIVYISETAANICTDEAKTIGVGSYLADYVLKQMTAGDLPFPPSESLGFLCAAAVYVAKEVRDNIQGVGPLKRVAIFNKDGTYDNLWFNDILSIEEHVSSIGEFLQYFYADAMDAERTDDLGDVGAGDIRSGLQRWFSEWKSEERCEARRVLRELEKRRLRAAGE